MSKEVLFLAYEGWSDTCTNAARSIEVAIRDGEPVVCVESWSYEFDCFESEPLQLKPDELDALISALVEMRSVLQKQGWPKHESEEEGE